MNDLPARRIPAALDERLATHEVAWRAIDLDRVCESEDGSEVVDGDGFGELVSMVDCFESPPIIPTNRTRSRRGAAGTRTQPRWAQPSR